MVTERLQRFGENATRSVGMGIGSFMGNVVFNTDRIQPMNLSLFGSDVHFSGMEQNLLFSAYMTLFALTALSVYTFARRHIRFTKAALQM